MCWGIRGFRSANAIQSFIAANTIVRAAFAPNHEPGQQLFRVIGVR
jgi:hypothetical protein